MAEYITNIKYIINNYYNRILRILFNYKNNNLKRLRAGSDRLVAIEKPKPLPFRPINTRRANAMRYILLDYIKEKPTRDMRGLYVILSKDKRKAMENIAAEALFQKLDVYPPQERFYPLHVKPTGDTYYIPEKKIDQMAYVVNKFRKKSNESINSDVTWEEESDTNLRESDEIVDLKTYKLGENIEKAEHLVDLLEQYSFVDKDDYIPAIMPVSDSVAKPFRSIYESTSTTETFQSATNRIRDKLDYCACKSEARIHPKSISATILPHSISDDEFGANRKESGVNAFSAIAKEVLDRKLKSKVTCSVQQSQQRLRSESKIEMTVHIDQGLPIRESKKDVTYINGDQSQIQKRTSSSCLPIQEEMTVDTDHQPQQTKKPEALCYDPILNVVQEKIYVPKTNRETKDTNKSDTSIQNRIRKRHLLDVESTESSTSKRKISDGKKSDIETSSESIHSKNESIKSKYQQIYNVTELKIKRIPSLKTVPLKIMEEDTGLSDNKSKETDDFSKLYAQSPMSTDQLFNSALKHLQKYQEENLEEFPDVSSDFPKDKECQKSPSPSRIKSELFMDTAKQSKPEILQKLPNLPTDLPKHKKRKSSRHKRPKSMSRLQDKSQLSADTSEHSQQEILNKQPNASTDLSRHKSQKSMSCLRDQFELNISGKSQHEAFEKLPNTSTESLRYRKRGSSTEKRPKSMSRLRDKSEFSETFEQPKQENLPNTPIDLSKHKKRELSKHKRSKSMSRSRDKSEFSEDTSEKSKHEKLLNAFTDMSKHRKRELSKHKHPRSISRTRDKSELTGEILDKLPNAPIDSPRHKKRESSKHKRHNSIYRHSDKAELNMDPLKQSKQDVSEDFLNQEIRESRYKHQKLISPVNQSELIAGTSNQGLSKNLNVPSELSKYGERELSRHKHKKSASRYKPSLDIKVDQSKQSKEILADVRRLDDLPRHRKRSRQKRQKSTSRHIDKSEIILDQSKQSKQEILETLPNVSRDLSKQRKREYRHNRRKSITSNNKSELVAGTSDDSTDFSMEKHLKSRRKRRKSKSLNNKSIERSTFNQSKDKILKELSHTPSETLKRKSQPTIAFADKSNIDPLSSAFEHRETQLVDFETQEETLRLLPDSPNKSPKSPSSNVKFKKPKKFIHKTLEKLAGTRTKVSKTNLLRRKSFSPTNKSEMRNNIVRKPSQLLIGTSKQSQSLVTDALRDSPKSNKYRRRRIITPTNTSEVLFATLNNSKHVVSEAPKELTKSQCNMGTSSPKQSAVYIDTSFNSKQIVGFAQNDLPNSKQHRVISGSTTNRSKVLIDDTPKYSEIDIPNDMSKSKSHKRRTVPHTNKSQVLFDTPKQSKHLVAEATNNSSKHKHHRRKSDSRRNAPSDLSKSRQYTDNPDMSESFRLHASEVKALTEPIHSKLEIDKLLRETINICPEITISPTKKSELSTKPSRHSKYKIDKLFNESNNVSQQSRRKSPRYDKHKSEVSSIDKSKFNTDSPKLSKYEKGNLPYEHRRKHKRHETSRQSSRNRDNTEWRLKKGKDKLIKHNTPISDELQISLTDITLRQPKHSRKTPANCLTPESLMTAPSGMRRLSEMNPDSFMTPANAVAPPSARNLEITMSSKSIMSPTSCISLASSIILANRMIPPSSMTPSMEPAHETTYHNYNVVGFEQATSFKSNLKKIQEHEDTTIETSSSPNKKSKSITGILKNKIEKPDTIVNADITKKISKSYRLTETKSRSRTDSRSSEDRKHRDVIKRDKTIDFDLVKQKLENLCNNESVNDNCPLESREYSQHNLQRKRSSNIYKSSKQQNEDKSKIVTSSHFFVKSDKSDNSSDDDKKNVSVLKRVQQVVDGNCKEKKRSGHQPLKFSLLHHDKKKKATEIYVSDNSDNQFLLHKIVEPNKSHTRNGLFNSLFKKKAKETPESTSQQDSSKSSMNNNKSMTESFIQLLKKRSRNTKTK